MRQKQAEGTHFPVGLRTLGVFNVRVGVEEEFKVEEHLETNLMVAFAKKEAGAASSGGKK